MNESKTTFRSTLGVPAHVPLTSGHAVRIPPEGKAIPSRFHRAAVNAGCLPMNAETYQDPSVRQPQEEREQLIADGIQKMLESSDPKAFTSNNQPNVSVLSQTIGFRVSKDEVLPVWKQIEAKLTESGSHGGDDGDDGDSDDAGDGGDGQADTGDGQTSPG